MLASYSLVLFEEIIVFFGFSFTVSLIIIKVLSDIAKRSQLPAHSIRDIKRATLSLWAAFFGIWLLQILNLTSIFSVLTLTGIIGLAITLALSATISNFFAGLWLIQDNTLRLGDTIKLGGVTGVVIKLSFRNTWLRTDEGKIAVVSNSTLYNGPFINFTATERLAKTVKTQIKRPNKLKFLFVKVGTKALVGSKKSEWVLLGGFVNASSVAKESMKIASKKKVGISFVLAGQKNNFALEDFICAGGILKSFPKGKIVLSDKALGAILAFNGSKQNLQQNISKSKHSQELLKIGFAKDIEYACQVDIYKVVPIYQNRTISLVSLREN